MDGLLLIAALTFTMPCTAQRCDSVASAEPLTDLDSLFLFARAGTSPPRLLRALNVRGFECFSFWLQSTGVAAGDSVWIVLSDRARNLSCRSNVVFFPVATAAPDPSAHDARSGAARGEWFDVAGRRLDGPPRRVGIYFHRDARGTPRRVVLVR